MKIDTLSNLVRSSENENEVDEKLLNAFVFNYSYKRFQNAFYKALSNFYKEKDKETINRLESFKDSISDLRETNKSKEKDFIYDLYLQSIITAIEMFLHD